jgi:hypothetical protein
MLPCYFEENPLLWIRILTIIRDPAKVLQSMQIWIRMKTSHKTVGLFPREEKESDENLRKQVPTVTI